MGVVVLAISFVLPINQDARYSIDSSSSATRWASNIEDVSDFDWGDLELDFSWLRLIIYFSPVFLVLVWFKAPRPVQDVLTLVTPAVAVLLVFLFVVSLVDFDMFRSRRLERAVGFYTTSAALVSIAISSSILAVLVVIRRVRDRAGHLKQ